MKSVLIFLVRYGIAALLILTGLVVAFASKSAGVEGWALFTGAGLSVLLLNLLFRIGVQGDREHDREEEARRYFDEHHRWPDGD
jgi:hypothetical protein